MIRHWKILEYALSSLLRRRGKNLAVLTVFVLTIGILSSILFLTHSLQAEAARLLAGAPALIVQGVSAGRHEPIDTAYLDPIRQIPGVAGAAPRIWGYYFDALTESNYTLVAAQGDRPDLTWIEGRLPEAPGECAVGEGVAQVRHLEVGGDLILVDGRNVGVVFSVVGVFRATSDLLTHDLVVFTPEDLAEFFVMPPDRATDLVVRVRNPNEVATVARKIKAALPNTRPITRSEILRTYEAVFDWRSGMLLAATFGAVVAFCVLAWDKATGLSAEERREIGILKAIGWDTADVLELKFWEGAALSVTALLFGLILAFVHVFLLGAPLLAPVLKGWSVLFPPFRLSPEVDLRQVLVVAFFTVVPYVASTVIPSWRAAIADPEAGMRG